MRVWIEIGRQRPWKAKKQFHPLMRVWIEILTKLDKPFTLNTFHPLMRVWIEIWRDCLNMSEIEVSPSYEGVD